MASSCSSSSQGNSLADSYPLMQFDAIKKLLNSSSLKGTGGYYNCYNQINEKIIALSKNALITPELKIILREFCVDFHSTDFETLSKKLESIRRLFSFILPPPTQYQDVRRNHQSVIYAFVSKCREYEQIRQKQLGVLDLEVVENEVFRSFAAFEFATTKIKDIPESDKAQTLTISKGDPFAIYELINPFPASKLATAKRIKDKPEYNKVLAISKGDPLKAFELLLNILGMTKSDLSNLQTDLGLSFEDIEKFGGLENALKDLEGNSDFISSKHPRLRNQKDINNIFIRLKKTILERTCVSLNTNKMMKFPLMPSVVGFKLSGEETSIPTGVLIASFPNLVNLQLNMRHLNSLPNDLVSMKKLKQLIIRQVSSEFFANEKQFQILSKLKNLKQLTLTLESSDKLNIQTLPPLPDSLSRVEIVGGITINNVPPKKDFLSASLDITFRKEVDSQFMNSGKDWGLSESEWQR